MRKKIETSRAGVWFYSLATVATGILDIVWGAFEPSHQPIQHIPGERVLAYLAGAWLVAAGMAVLWRRAARMGIAGSAMIYVVFALFWLPRFHAMTQKFGFRMGVIIFVLGGVGAQILLAAPAAIISPATAFPDTPWRERAAVAGRWMLGLPPILFGLGHLVSLHAYARFVPHWLPFGNFWLIITGIAFILAGCAIVSGIRDILAARCLALMLLVFEAAVEIPPVFMQPHSQVAWGGALYNLTAIGVCLIFAEFVAGRRQPDQPITSVSENMAVSCSSSVIV
jgi:uncharacterized membrane protein YphA (DoxX/SURF4 family)